MKGGSELSALGKIKGASVLLLHKRKSQKNLLITIFPFLTFPLYVLPVLPLLHLQPRDDLPLLPVKVLVVLRMRGGGRRRRRGDRGRSRREVERVLLGAAVLGFALNFQK